jgi:hypothetical protein
VNAGAASDSAPASPASPALPSMNPTSAPDDAKAEAMANSTVQALLEIFPVEKTTVEER